MKQIFVTVKVTDMNNPFETIDARLSNIESLLLDIKHKRETPQNPDPEYLTIEEASDFVHEARPTLYFKAGTGQIPSIKRGKRLLFAKSDLIKYLQDGRRGTSRELQVETAAFLHARAGGAK